MPERTRPAPKSERQRHFIRQWREHRSWSQPTLIERLENVEPPYVLSVPQLSRIERGEQAYNQDLLEALAKVFGTEAASLVMRDPGDPDGIWSIWDTLSPTERAQGIAVLKAIKTPTPADLGAVAGVAERGRRFRRDPDKPKN